MMLQRVFAIAALCFASSCTAAGQAPTWPDQAHIQVSTNQILHDAPATTEAELRRRTGRYGYSLFWPAAAGAVRYEVRRGKVVLETTDKTRHSGEHKGKQTVTVVALSKDGKRSAPLSADIVWTDPLLAQQGPGLLAMVAGKGADTNSLGSLLGGTGATGGIGSLGSGSSSTGLFSDIDKAKRGARTRMRLGDVTLGGPGIEAAVVRRVMRRTTVLVRRDCDVESAKLRMGKNNPFAIRAMIKADGRLTAVDITAPLASAKPLARCIQQTVAKVRLPKPTAAPIRLATKLFILPAPPAPPAPAAPAGR